MNRMDRRMFLRGVAGFACGAVLPRAGAAQSAEDSARRQLQRQGFTVTSSRRTLLGRVRILARKGDLRREIVVNPSTGVILRDFTRRLGGDDPQPNVLGGQGSGGTSGGSGGIGDDDDDDGDDDNDDDDGGNDGGGDDGGDDGGEDD